MTEFRRRGGWWVAAQGLLLGAVIVGIVLGGSLPWPVTIVGAVLLAGGLGLGVAAVAHLSASLTPFPEPRQRAELVTSGVYGRARHPMYGALTLGSIGVALLVRSPWSLVAAVALAILLAFKSAAEERRLSARYQGYDAYRRSVPHRFLPRLW